jgi:predicted NAD/FAD-binding protein
MYICLNQQDLQFMRIAIIGAGVSGLTTAWFLRKKFSKEQAFISVFDYASKIGGNANTMDIILKGEELRWADMGVNDFNKVTYENFVALWRELGILDTGCKPLINEESFWKGGTSNYKYWVNTFGEAFNPPSSPAKAKEIIQPQLKRFKKELSDWYKGGGLPDPQISVGQWITGKFPGDFYFDKEFIDNNLYPRINGMYYTREVSPPGVPPPSLMPLWMVAHYYVLQEGYALNDNEVEEARQYFVGGSIKWLILLTDKLIAEGINIGAATMGKTELGVYQNPQTREFYIRNGTTDLVTADIVIFATHADVTKGLIRFAATSSGDQRMMDALGDFSYGENAAWAYSHQDPSMIPGDGCDKTYNIHIYDYTKPAPGNRWPYTITYIENYHQALSPVGPLFFTTLNPFIGRAPMNITRQQKDRSQAVTAFRHCKLDLAVMQAQKKINDVQILAKSSVPRPFYFAGSFTIGAGLHEECVIQAKAIANKIANPMEADEDHIYNFEPGAKNFAPKYIMNAIRRK